MFFGRTKTQRVRTINIFSISTAKTKFCASLIDFRIGFRWPTRFVDLRGNLQACPAERFKRKTHGRQTHQISLLYLGRSGPKQVARRMEFD